MIVPLSPSRRPSDAPNKTRLRKAARQEKKKLRRIERALAAGRVEKARFLQRRYLASFDVKLTSVVAVNKKLAKDRRVHKTRLIQNAEALNPWRGTNELARAYALPKAGGGFRAITSYGAQARALQQMVRCAVRPFARFDPRQHAVTNGGRDAAIAKVKDGVAHGLKWFVRLDIASFYQNVDERRLINFVPAPRGVILHTVGSPRNVVLGHSSRVVDPRTLLLASQRGLSQGAGSSPIIAEMIVAQILGQISSDAVVINCSDDFAVMARTRREVVSLSEALTSAVRRCPHGHLQLEPKSAIRRVSDGFSFLGYDFRFRRSRLKCEPSRSNIAKFVTKAALILRRPSAEAARNELQRYVRSWRNAFSQWDAGPDMLAPRVWILQISKILDANALRVSAT